MSRFKHAFKQKAKIAYLTAGDGESIPYFLALARAGATILEIGIPFSDPIADGPVIQRAMQRSLQAGTNVEKVLEGVRHIRASTDAALVLFSYFNPIHHHLSTFLQNAKSAGADGVLIVDLPYEESKEFREACISIGIAPIAVAAPSTPLDRIALLTQQNSGFLYYACRKGTTGARETLPEGLKETVQEIRKRTQLPIAVGFGIANQTSVKECLTVADGCVVGSYFVSQVEKKCSVEELEEKARSLFTC